jgi:site-specific DNA recombinase
MKRTIMKRAAVYIRMSTDDQADSPDRQKSQIDPYCEKHGYKVVKTYEDHGMRGSDNSRPQFQAMLKDARAGHFHVIVVDEVSRLSRETPMDYIVNVAYPLREADVAVESVAEGRQNWDELVGMILMAVRQDKASQESATLGRRVATGMLRRAKEAKTFVGRAPYGMKYKLDETGNRVGYLPGDPEHVRAVRDIFDTYLNHDGSLTSIARGLNEDGIAAPLGGEWGKTTVHHILTSPVYAGSYVWGKVPQGRYYRCDGEEVVKAGRNERSYRRPPEEWTVVIPDCHEAIVEPKVFDAVQERLANNRCRTSGSRAKDQYVLAGILFCSHCGSPLYGTRVKSGGIPYPSYRCGSSMNTNTCANRTVRETVIVEKLAGVLKEKFLNPSVLDRLRVEVERQRTKKADDGIDRTNTLKRKVEKLDRDIEKAKDNLMLLDSEDIPRAKERIREWQQERADAQAQLDRKTTQSPAGSFDLVATRLKRLVETLRTAEPSLIRTLLRDCIYTASDCRPGSRTDRDSSLPRG